MSAKIALTTGAASGMGRAGARDSAVFLASDEATRMTGGIHIVDSGHTAFKGPMDIKATVGR